MEPRTTDNGNVWSMSSRRYRSFDADLLKTGLLADVEVHCVETKRIWKVHKVILCSRSEWFKKALTGRTWKEGRTGIVKIRETPENHINLLLTFIYTGAIDLEKYFGEDYLWISSMKVWKLADFFCLDELKALSIKARDTATLHWAKTYARHLNKNTLSDFPPKMLKSIVLSISGLYQYGRDDINFMKAFKSQLLGTAISGILVLSQDFLFESVLRMTPKFAFDWSLELMSCVGATAIWDHSIGGHKRRACGECGILKLVDTELYPNTLKWTKLRVVERVCENCFSTLTLKQLGKT